MKVTARKILARGLANRCPNCGEATLFPPGAGFRIRPECPRCGLKFNRGEGFFLGPLVINYGITALGFVVPVILLWSLGVFGARTAIVAVAVGTVLLPVLLYRRSWGWWLTSYFLFLPQKLPANGDETGDDQEE